MTGVRWIGGGSGAGKSTVSRLLADRHRLVLHDTDAAMAEHADRTTPATAPELHRFMAMSPDQRWVHRDPAEMVASFHWFRGEGFAEIEADLRLRPTGEVVLVEGFRLLPDLVAPLLADPADAVWLLPTPRMRAAVFAARGGRSWSIPARTSDPERALRNLAERDRLFTEQLATRTAELGLESITVDLDTDLVELAERLARRFRLPGPAGGSAASTG